jgi:hypothetical protein
MSQRAWCAAQGVNVNTYGYWQRQLRVFAPTRAKSRGQALVPVRVQPTAISSGSNAAIEIALPGGIALRTAAVDVRWLAALVRELGAC